jgi:hypothetical protein
MNIILGFILDAYFTLKDKKEKEENVDNLSDYDTYCLKIKDQLPSTTTLSLKSYNFVSLYEVKRYQIKKRGFYEAVRLFG